MNLDIDLAVLDIAATTVEQHEVAHRALCEAVGSDDVTAWMGADEHEAVRGLLGDPDDGTVARVHADFRRRLADAYAAEPPEPFPGATQTLALLRENGVKVALTTGFDREIAGVLLADPAWDEGVIDAVVCADEVPAGRPAPYMIFRAMERTGVCDVARVLVAGDTVLDLQAGANAGAGFVVALLSGGAAPEMLGAHRHTHMLESVTQLPAILSVQAYEPA